MHDVVLRACVFCGESESDDRRHWVHCRVLQGIFDEMYADSTTMTMSNDVFHIQVPLDGRTQQLLLAFLHATWRCRCVIVRGFTFSSNRDLSNHFHALIEDPWLHGNPGALSRYERRASVCRPPSLPENYIIYFCDGASRKTRNGTLASYGALMQVNGGSVSRLAASIGDCTNNEAEYQGALAALRHAVSVRCSRIFMYGDSKLVVSQMTGLWKCKSMNLMTYYEEGLALMRQLAWACEGGVFRMAHIYREHNANADALANEAIDRYTGSVVVVSDNWHNPQTPARL